MVAGSFLIGLLLIALGMGIYFKWYDGRCWHYNTKCIHGDEIMDVRGKGYYRQRCLDCGRAIKRPPICAFAGPHYHEWNSEWPPDWSWKREFIYKK